MVRSNMDRYLEGSKIELIIHYIYNEQLQEMVVMMFISVNKKSCIIIIIDYQSPLNLYPRSLHTNLSSKLDYNTANARRLNMKLASPRYQQKQSLES